MATLEKEILIHAPVEKIFAFMNDPHNLPEIWPSMVEVKNATINAINGYDFDWLYKMGGMHFEGASKTTEWLRNKRIVTRSTKGIESRFAWDYIAEGEYTRITLDIEYRIPIPLIGQLAETIIMKQNEHEAVTMLNNLKDKMEIKTPVTA